MKKTGKKTNLRIRRRIRKTLGTLLLITSIVIAAIPSEGLEARESNMSDATTGDFDIYIDITGADKKIPLVNVSETIYTTGDGTYRFAYISASGAGGDNKFAVIMGYSGGYLPGNTLTIPDTVDAYRQYSDAMGTSNGYVAVTKNNEFLFYKVLDYTDDDGVDYYIYQPCYYGDIEHWINTVLYYYDGANYQVCDTDIHSRLQNATVKYIGNQYVEAYDNGGGDSGWKVAGTITDETHGIFAGNSNIRTLIVGEKLCGIGDYAFYGCGALASINLGNGLESIGNFAFKNCVNMSSINVDVASNLAIIGAEAFYNCQGLTGFSLPIAVTRIGDYAFAGCIALKNLDLCSAGNNNLLEKIGPYAFINCVSLEKVEFPLTFTNNSTDLDLGIFKGCTALKAIISQNTSLNIKPITLSYSDFKNTVPEEFYFEGKDVVPSGVGTIHQICKDNEFAFKYYGEDRYEITTGTGVNGIVYTVSEENGLEDVYIANPAAVTVVKIPRAIGPCRITNISSGTFSSLTNMAKVIIPSSIKTIDSYAFRGCYSLNYVVFEDASSVESIGTDAFKTQYSTDTGVLALLAANQSPFLYMVGDVGDDIVPFQYAMDSNNNINDGSQPLTYITYYGEWPENLVIRYNPQTDSNELIDYPTLNKLASGYYNSTYYDNLTADSDTCTAQANACAGCVSKYLADGTMTADETKALQAALNITIPSGVESIKPGIVETKENDESTYLTSVGATYEANPKFLKTVSSEGLKAVGEEAFKGFTNLEKFSLLGDAVSIGDHAFQDCDNLTTMYVADTVNSIGVAPWVGCDSLTDVQFIGNNYYTCDNSIIYKLDSDGKKVFLLEMLYGRSSGVIMPDEIADVEDMGKEAFMGTNISSIDFRSSKLSAVSERAFENTPALYSVYLPSGCTAIDKDSFKDSAAQYLEIPRSVAFIDSETFTGSTSGHNIIFYCVEDSVADIYANRKDYISQTYMVIVEKYTVTFWDYDNTLLGTQEVVAGEDAVPPTTPARDGYTFDRWVPSYKAVSSDLQCTAEYTTKLSDSCTVRFIDHDDKVLYTQSVKYGEDCITPQDPTWSGHKFVGWRPAITKITKDTDVYAQYEASDNPEDRNNTGLGTSTKLHTLTVLNGTGSGSYIEGTQVIIVANKPASGKEFDHWTVSPKDTVVTDTKESATILTMPNNDVAIVAQYVKSAKTTNSKGNSASSNSTATTNKKPTNSVDINKNGFSNTGVVSVTVNGSSDNFVVKITDSEEASEAVVKALKAEYGDISGIKYVPMDISLYDSTGKKKITDTTGLSVTITLPIPDSLIPYAGNNKVAGVVDGKLDKLTPKFKTISGVSCITFTAEHFSPYVIYVDTDNLTSAVASDQTPKTADGFNPKWFISLAMAALAMFLFLKKDKYPVPVKAVATR